MTGNNSHTVASLPISQLQPGEVAPPMMPNHASWKTLGDWDDPLAPWAGYRLESRKTRTDTEAGPALEWSRGSGPYNERAFVTGRSTWRDYSVECRMQALQSWDKPSYDNPAPHDARAGIAFRIETSRRYYFFCIEGQQRLVLYRRNDDEWHALASKDVSYEEQIITLSVHLDGDGIRVQCPELDTELSATDTLIESGKAGYRASGQCRLFDLKVRMTPSQKRRNDARNTDLVEKLALLDGATPDEELVEEIDLTDGKTLLESADFHAPDRPDLLLGSPEGIVARTWDGNDLWHLDEKASDLVTVSAWREPDGGRLIYALVGERKSEKHRSVRGIFKQVALADEIIAINGVDGKILARARLPDIPDGLDFSRFDTSCETAPEPLDGKPAIIVRGWQHGGGQERNLWAYDRNLDLLWRRAVETPFGHHNAVHILDVNKDGNPEIMAGGTLLSCDGATLAAHDRQAEIRQIAGAWHYDAVVIGDFADDIEMDPVAFLISGSAGVYVIDPLTGVTRATHRVGHAQGGCPCKLREDLPGREVVVGTRWENYGIITLFSGRGDRLWSIQPNYILSLPPVQWLDKGPQFLWISACRETQGLYDGYGRLVKPLRKIRKLWENKTPMDVSSRVIKRDLKGPDLLAVTIDDRIHVFGPKGI